MARRIVIAVLVISFSLPALGLGPAAIAQTKPDFTGTWTRVDDAPEQASIASAGDVAFVVGSMGSGWGSPLTIRQSPDLLQVEYPHFIGYDLQPPIRWKYALNGSDSLNTVMIGHADSVQRSQAKWQEHELVITTQIPIPGDSERVHLRRVLSLESPEVLVIETTRTGLGDRPATITRTRYTKA